MRLWAVILAGAWLCACGPTVGDACTTTDDCGKDLCLNQPSLPGGYCSVACHPGTCPNGSTCVENGGQEGNSACYRQCTTKLECRSGYDCQDIPGSNGLKVCVGEGWFQ